MLLLITFIFPVMSPILCLISSKGFKAEPLKRNKKSPSLQESFNLGQSSKSTLFCLSIDFYFTAAEVDSYNSPMFPK